MDEIIKKLYYEFSLTKNATRKKDEKKLKEGQLHDKLKSTLSDEQNKIFDEFIDLVFDNLCEDIIRSFGDGIKFTFNLLGLDYNSVKEKLNKL